MESNKLIIPCKPNDNDDKLHIAMFPWLAFGHMIPYLELAKAIAQKGHKISFVSSPRNIDRLPKLPPHLATLITFVKIPLPYVENLPESAEATTDLPMDVAWYLKKAYDGLQEPLSNFLQNYRPNWIAFDFVSHWLPDIARKFNIPSVYFSPFFSSVLCYLCSGGNGDYRKDVEDYIVPPKWVPFPSTVAYSRHEILKMFRDITSEKLKAPGEGKMSMISDFERLQETMKRCNVIAVRSCFEFESEWLKLTEQLQQKPVFPIGVLPRDEDDDLGSEEETWKPIKKWLDSQEKGSVAYIAFGTENQLSQEEVNEIALGLELSELPFLWVFRMINNGILQEEVIELPNGFEERVKGRGMVWTEIVPQFSILRHESIGGYLTHGGGGSVLEGLQCGIPIVLLASHADQGLNVKLFCEKNMGYLMPRNEDDGSFTRNSVADSLRLVILENEGKFYRDKAKEMSAFIGDKDTHSSYVARFLRYLIDAYRDN